MKHFKSGDIVMMDFQPTKGHEQSGRRPAIIVNNTSYTKYVQMAIVCPISNVNKLFPLHLPLDNRTHTTGYILCEHIRTVDLSKRNAKFVETLPSDIFEEVSDIIISFFE